VRADVMHTGGPDLEIYGAGWKAGAADSVIFYAVPVG